MAVLFKQITFTPDIERDYKMTLRLYPSLPSLVSLAESAGSIIRTNFCPGMKSEWKTDGTPITVSDNEINQLVIDWFEQNFPHISVIGEEGLSTVPNSEYTVFVDPIDGTVPFCHGIPVSTFCLAIVDNKTGRPVIGIIHDPFLKRIWYAEARQGAFFNGKLARVSDHRMVPRSIVSVMWWNDAAYDFTNVLGTLVRNKAICINLFSVAICGGLISTGEMTASIFPSKNCWETAVMDLIVTEAGGHATDLFGHPLTYNGDHQISGHIISNGFVHEQLVDLVKTHTVFKLG